MKFDCIRYAIEDAIEESCKQKSSLFENNSTAKGEA